MSETAAQRFVAGAYTLMRTTDLAGRSIVMRRPTALDRLRIFKAIGAELSQNPPYLGMAILASSVTEIDGVPVPAPINEAQLEALVKRLGDDGIEAVAATFEESEPAPNGDFAGNSVGTPT
jgi:hypothetical protein